MSTGTVKSFDRAKGYGFIEPDDGTRDVFIHGSVVEQAGMGTLAVGQKVSYLLRHDHKTRKMAASDLRAR